MIRAYYRVLRDNPNFRLLWGAQAISLLGDWFNTIVLSALVARYSDGSGLAIGALLLARFLPPLLVSPLAGVLLDRFDRKRLLILSDLARALVVLGFLVVDEPGKLWIIYVLTIVQFTLSAVFEPGRSALLPSVVRRQDLIIANILGSVTWSVMLAIGGALGGTVAALFGTAVALLIDSATFLLSGLLIWRVRVDPTDEAASATSAEVARVSRRWFDLQDFIDGLRFARQNPAVAATLFVKMGGSVGSLDTIIIVYATVLFVLGQDGSGSLGILWGAFGLGAAIGPFLVNRFNDGTVRCMRRLIIWGYAFIVMGWVLLGGAGSLWVAALALLVRAIGSDVYWMYSSVILQKTVPDRYLGRIFALDMALFQLSTVISVIVTGILLEILGSEAVRQIVYWTGAAALAPLILWILTVAWIERQPEAEPAVEV